MRKTRYVVCEPARKGCWPILRLRAKGGERPQVSGMWQKRGKCCSALERARTRSPTGPRRRDSSTLVGACSQSGSSFSSALGCGATWSPNSVFLGPGVAHIRPQQMQAECAICFDSIGEDAIPLPCSCRVPYCLACWDRSLAVSFNDTGHARCPTCRTPVRVDFDPEAAGGRGRLVFTREDGDQGDIDRSRSGVVNRLQSRLHPS